MLKILESARFVYFKFYVLLYLQGCVVGITNVKVNRLVA